MTQAYFQFKAGDQMCYYKRMLVVTQSGFPSVIITPYCVVWERSKQVRVIDWRGEAQYNAGGQVRFCQPMCKPEGL